MTDFIPPRYVQTDEIRERARGLYEDGLTDAAEIMLGAAKMIEQRDKDLAEQDRTIEAQQDTLAAWTFMHSTLIGASAAVGVHESYRVLAQGLLELIPDDRLQSERIDAMMAVLRANRGKLR